MHPPALALTHQHHHLICLEAPVCTVQIRDAAFLHRYSEPVLLVLHEVRPTWAGMLREAKDTVEATALSVNVLHRRFTRLWSVPNLPSDAAAVMAVPCGGAMVLCRSLLIYVSQVCELPVISMLLSMCHPQLCHDAVC